MANIGTAGTPSEVALESWLIAAFHAERLPRRQRPAISTQNPITTPLRPAGVGLIYWMTLAATLATWLLR